MLRIRSLAARDRARTNVNSPHYQLSSSRASGAPVLQGEPLARRRGKPLFERTCKARQEPGQDNLDAYIVRRDVDMRLCFLGEGDDADVGAVAGPRDFGMGEFLDIGRAQEINLGGNTPACFGEGQM